jgi:hypothetical protein
VAIVNVDSERPLAVVRASGAKSDISLGSQHFGVGVAIGGDADMCAIHQVLGSLYQVHSITSRHFEKQLPVMTAGTFEIEDLLVGPKCRQHRYLARSYESLDTVQLPSVILV